MDFLRNREIMEMCQILAEQEQLKVTIQESVKAGFLAGCGAIMGGLMGGPIGIALGGTLGSITGAWCSKGKFKSVAEILRNDLSPNQQQKLIKHVKAALQKIRPEDWVSLLTIVLTSASLKEIVIKEIGTFLLNELNLTMVEGIKEK
ncbi:protein C19orf12 homolog [Diorhabda sublineata]|uniref:protein C19orf12 homolog n=1 Tax=Diorhabda sublineata TaxID=1163346 RepID=UPI0024E14D76|nr:protein C19orf12 homolog [Diorhabda sublineata]